MMKKLLIATLLAGSFATGMSVVLPAAAAVIIVREAPPPPRAERVPKAKRGYVWAPGHWEWKRQRHVWVRGTWIKERNGYAYQPASWEERDGRWQMTRGEWRRGDRDGDGVRNRDDNDRDGDGVRNRNDDRPNNPNRN